MYLSQGNYKQALERYEEAFAMQQAVYGNVDHPNIATSFESIGLANEGLGHYSEAKKCYEICLSMRIAVYSSSIHPETKKARCLLDSLQRRAV
mgnify:CR=1 FL=1